LLDRIFQRDHRRREGSELLGSRTCPDSAIVVAELSEKHKRLKREFGPKYDFVKARTSLVPSKRSLPGSRVNSISRERRE